jgi:hypothetical protein
MKAIGYIKMVKREQRFGFIFTIPFDMKGHKTVDVHFRLREWCELGKEPEIGMCVCFNRNVVGTMREEATQIEELCLSKSHLSLALDYAVHGYKILGFDKKQGKVIPRSVLRDLFDRLTGEGDFALVRSVFREYFCSYSDVDCESAIDKLLQNKNIRETMFLIFRDDNDGYDKKVLNAIQHLKERIAQKREHHNEHKGKYIGIVKWFSPCKGSAGEGYIVTNRHGYADLKNAQGELIEPMFNGDSWIESNIQPRKDDIVIYERGGRFGELAIKVRLLTDSVDDLCTVFQYAPESIKIEGMAYKSVRLYNKDLLNYAARKVLQQRDKNKAVTIFRAALLSVDEHRRNFICDNIMLDSTLAVRLRELFFHREDGKVGCDEISEMVRAKLLASLSETMRAEQEKLVNECELNYWRDAIGDRRLIGRFVKGKTEVEDVRFPTFGRLNRELLVFTDYIPSDHTEYCFFEWKFSSNDPDNPCRIETLGTPVPIFPQAIVDMVHKQVDKDPDTRQRYAKAVETIRNQLVRSGIEVFIYELLQNADDYPNGDEPVDVEIVLTNEYLIFRHSGRCFDAENVAAICDINAGEKTRKKRTIGYKGIGFKTVFAGTDCVYIRTGEYSFAFDKRESEKRHIPWEVAPYWRTDDDIDSEVLSCFQSGESKYRVSIAIHPDSAAQISGYAAVLETMFSDEKSILFLRNVRSVKVKFADGYEKQPVSNDGGGWQKSREQYVDEISGDARKLIENAIATNNPKIPQKYADFLESSVSFACRVDGSDLGKKVLKADYSSTLYCYLPAKNACWGFGFIFNSDMIPNGGRDDIEVKDEYDTTNPAHDLNLILARSAGSRFFDWLEELLSAKSFTPESIFALIPNFDECIKNHSRYKDFINAFRTGFKQRLKELQLPNEAGEMIDAKLFTLDETGVSYKFAEGFTTIFSNFKFLVPAELSQSQSFKRFLGEYSEELGISRYSYDKLRNDVLTNEKVLEWLTGKENNARFITHIVEEDKLELFSTVQIFLDNHGQLGKLSEMYFYGDDIKMANKYLTPFNEFYRYISITTPVLDSFKESWFRSFSPVCLIRDDLLPHGEQIRELLVDIEIAKKFLMFLITSHLQDVQNGVFFKNVVGSMLAVANDGSIFDCLSSTEHSVFVSEENEVSQILNNARWVDRKWIRFLKEDYFNDSDGTIIRKVLSEHSLINECNLRGVVDGIIKKFKSRIIPRMKAFRSDLGFYDFISDCLREQCLEKTWIINELGDWPVQDADGKLVDRDGKRVYYYNVEILDWIQKGWIRTDAFVVMHKKYSAQKELFDLLGVEEFSDDNFGELFKDCFSSNLSLDETCKVIAFHKYMANKRDLFVTIPQVASLKHTPVLLYGHDSPILRGEEVVYLPPDDIDVDAEIEAGRLQNGIRILDSSMCGSPVMREYWKGLDCKELQEADLLEEKIKAYLDEQGKYLRQEISQNDFVSKQECFVKSICAICVDDWKNKYPALLKLLKTKMLLLEKKSLALKKPSELTLGTVYKPRCEHERFGLELAYVHDGFADSSMVDQVRTFLVEIDVNNCFAWDDASFFSSHPEFCKYFWSEYLPTITHSFSEKWIEHLSSVPSLLSQTGEVRRPDELYSPELSGKIGEQVSWKCHLPDFSGFGEKAMQEAIRLSLRSIPYFNDIIDYLLISGADKALALEWLAQYDTLTPEEKAKVDEYRESPNALWENSQGDLCQIKQLVTIAFANSDVAKALSGHVRAIRIRKLGRAEIREKALRHLRVKIVSDKDLIPERIKSSDQRDVFSVFLPGMLVYVACREGDGWKEVFEKYKDELAKCSFVRCDKIGLHYEDMCLENRHFCRGEKNHELYYVGEPQGRRVFESMVRAIREWLGIKGDIEELKDVFDPETNLDTMLIEKCRGLLEDEKFKVKLKEVSTAVYDAVLMKSSDVVDPPLPPGGTGTSNDQDIQSVPVTEKPSSKGDDGDDKDNLHEGSDHAKDENKEEQKKWFNDVEAEQMRRVFRNDLTVEEMNDINRLDCIRLFNSLKAQGFEPRYLIGGNEQREKEYDGRSPELLESDFINDVFDKKINHSATIETNDGRIIHVIGAINGVAHLPPRWWTRIARQTGKQPVKYVICAIVYHKEDGFQYLQTRADLMNAIGDRFTVVRIQSESKEERFEKTLALFASDPECSDFSTYSLLLLHKMRSDTSYECVFTEDFREDSKSEW